MARPTAETKIRTPRVPPILLVLAAGLALRLLIAYVLFPGEGFGSDLRLFGRWAATMADFGPGRFYSNAGFIDYPPGYLYVLWVIGLVGKVLGAALHVAPAAVVAGLVKLPAIAADLLIAILLYRTAGQWRDRRAGLIAAALFLFIPVTWYDSALWGQVDAVGALLVLATVLLLIRGWSEPAAIMAMVATATKPQYAIVLGIVAIVLLRRHLLAIGSGPQLDLAGWRSALDRRLGGWLTHQQGPRRLVSSGVLGVLALILLVLPFDLPSQASVGLARIPVLGHLAGLASVIGSAASFYNVLTVNAFNPWALVGPTPLSHVLNTADYGWTFDSLRLFGIQAVTIGSLAFVITALGVAAALILRDDRRTILVGTTVLAVAFFVLPTRVHERYLFTAFAPAALLAATSLRWRWWYVALSLVNVANLHAILTLPYEGYGTPPMQALPFGSLARSEWAIVVLSLAHAALLGWAVYRLVRIVRARSPVAIALPDWRSALARLPRTGRVERAGALSWWPRSATRPEPAVRRPRAPIDRRDAGVAGLLLLVVLVSRLWRLDTPLTMYFDEGLHVRSAIAFLQDWRYGSPHYISEWSHPHVSKYLMAASVMAFGGDRLTGFGAVGHARDAALQPVSIADATTGALGGDRLAVATDDGLILASHANLATQLTLPLPGATAVAFDPTADRLYVGSAGGAISAVDLRAADAGSPAIANLAQLDIAIEQLVAFSGRLVARATDGQLRLVDSASGQVLASGSLSGLQQLLAVTTGSRTRLYAASTTGIAELDQATLQPGQFTPVPAPAVALELVDGNERDHLDRSLLSIPTLFVATAPSRLETFELGTDGKLSPSEGMDMPGPVRGLRWDRTTNMLHALATSPSGATAIYEVDPVERVVFADEVIPFEPSAWVIDAQPAEPSLDRQRILAFSEGGAAATLSAGNDPFAWRVPGALAGSLMAPLLYLLARVLFRRRRVAVMLALLLPIEGLLFSQARIAMNDAFVGLFVVAALTLLAWLLEVDRPRWRRAVLLLGLPTVGLLLGLALGSKWAAAYAIGAAVLLVLIRSPLGRWIALAGFVGLTAVFGWLAVAGRPPNYTFLLLMIGLTLVAAVLVRRNRVAADESSEPSPRWADPRFGRALPFAWALLCLTIVPLVVYVATYVPWALSAGGSPQLFPGWPAGHTGQTFLDLQVQMYRFHDLLRQQYGASSPWWAWPLGLKPIWAYYGAYIDGSEAMVLGTGNPLLLWLAAAAVVAAVWRAWTSRSTGLGFALICFLAVWLPWARIDRFTLNYHWYLALPFALMLLAWLLVRVWEGPSPRLWLAARVALVAAVLLPALMWLFKGSLCSLGGVGSANPGAEICSRPLPSVLVPVLVWSVAAIGLAVFALRWLKPRQYVIGVVGAAAILFIALYPALAAWRLPHGLVNVYTGLLPTWDGSFEFASNQLAAVPIPLIRVGSVVLLVGLGAAAAWLAGLGSGRWQAPSLATLRIPRLLTVPSLPQLSRPAGPAQPAQPAQPAKTSEPPSRAPRVSVAPLHPAAPARAMPAATIRLPVATDTRSIASELLPIELPDDLRVGDPPPENPEVVDDSGPTVEEGEEPAEDEPGEAEPEENRPSEDVPGADEPGEEPEGEQPEGDAPADGEPREGEPGEEVDAEAGEEPGVPAPSTARQLALNLAARMNTRWTIVGIGVVSFLAAVLAARVSGLNGPWLWNYDMPVVNYPWAVFLHQALASGRLPLWSDSMGMGMPLYAAGNVQAFYPPNWLIFQLPPLVALDVSRVLHLTIAGIGTGLITLRLSGSRSGSLAAALIAVLCGGITTKLEWTEILVAYSWIPWVLLPLLWERKGPTARMVALAALPWGIQALAGHPQTWVLTGICAAAVILVRQPTRRGIVRLAIFGLLGAGVGAVQLLPTAFLTTMSTRAGGVSTAQLFEFSATPFDFLGVAFANAWAPLQGSYWDSTQTWYTGVFWAALEGYAYIGLPALAFMVVGLRVRRARPLIGLVLVMIAIPIIGAFQPAIWAAIPGLNGLRHPIRGYMLVDLALAVGAGLGVARLGRSAPSRWPLVALGLVTGGYAAVAGLVVLAPATFQQLAHILWPSLGPGDLVVVQRLARDALTSPWPLALELLLGLLTLALLSQKWRVPALRIAAVALVATPLVLLGPNANDRRGLDAFSLADTNWMVAIRQLQPDNVALVTSRGHPYTNQLVLAGINDLDIDGPLGLKGTADLQALIGFQPDGPFGRAVGVDVSLAFGAPCVGREVSFDPAYDARVCVLENVLHPPYWLPSAAVQLPAGSASPIRPAIAGLDVVQVLNGAVPASITSWDEGSAAISVDAPAPGYLFIDRAWWPEWQVSVDGAGVTPYSAWGGQLVPVGAGRHQVEQRLVPWIAYASGAVTLVTLLGVVVALLAVRRRAGMPLRVSARDVARSGFRLRWRREP